MGWKMRPYEHHITRLQEIIEEHYGLQETPKNERAWNTYWWFNDTTEAMRLCIRELLEYCNNSEVAEKAWLLLDSVEVGE